MLALPHSIKWPAIWAAGKCIEADEDETPPDLFIRVAAREPEEVARLLRWAARWPHSDAWELPDAEAHDRAREFIQACGDMAAGWKAEKDRYVTLNTRMQRGIRDLGLTARVKVQEEAETRARQAPPDEEETRPEISEEPVAPDPALDVPYEDTGKTLRQVWQNVLEQLQLEMPKATFDTWVKEAKLVTHEEGTFVVGVANAYARDWLENRLLKTVERTLSGIVGREVEVRFEVKAR